MEDVFVVFDAVKSHLVESHFAVWEEVGASDGEGAREDEVLVQKDWNLGEEGGRVTYLS